VLLFDSPKVPFQQWQESYQKKMQGFFGRDVEVQLEQPQENQVELALIARTGSLTTLTVSQPHLE
jgi:hypothetical protein